MKACDPVAGEGALFHFLVHVLLAPETVHRKARAWAPARPL